MKGREKIVCGITRYIVGRYAPAQQHCGKTTPCFAYAQAGCYEPGAEQQAEPHSYLLVHPAPVYRLLEEENYAKEKYHDAYLWHPGFRSADHPHRDRLHLLRSCLGSAARELFPTTRRSHAGACLRQELHNEVCTL